MIRTTTRQTGLVALGATIAIAITTMATAASASPNKPTVDGDALSRALSFETALTESTRNQDGVHVFEQGQVVIGQVI